MAIVQNKATSLGDIILIQTSVPILGIVTLQSFVDNVVGETSTKFFNKKFRYSTDGINYSLWIPLTTINISNIVVSPSSNFLIEYSYERVGTDNTGDLSFIDNTLIGTFNPLSNGPIYANSPFATFFPSYDPKVLTWCLNVCEKLYKPGIIPIYLTRNENRNQNNEDEDYMAFWCTVCCFFSLFVNFARLFENFDLHKDILEEYILQKGLFINNNLTIVELNHLMNNYYNEISKRGTLNIINKKTNGFIVDGELLRLLSHDTFGDGDIIFSLTENYKLGWNLGNSSPLYRGNFKANMSIVGYEKNSKTIDISKYPITNPSQISIIPDSPNGYIQDTFKFDFSNNLLNTGILLPIAPTTTNNLIKIDNLISYEITFDYKIINNELKFIVECAAFDSNLNYQILQPINGGINNQFIDDIHKGVLNQWYSFRGIIYGLNVTTSNLELKPTIGNSHLKFQTNNTKFISPHIYIKVDNPLATLGDFRLANLKIRPLTTPYSTGFIQTQNFINIWGENKNNKYTDEEIYELERKFLIPYNSHLSNININNNQINNTI